MSIGLFFSIRSCIRVPKEINVGSKFIVGRHTWVSSDGSLDSLLLLSERERGRELYIFFPSAPFPLFRPAFRQVYWRASTTISKEDRPNVPFHHPFGHSSNGGIRPAPNDSQCLQRDDGGESCTKGGPKTEQESGAADGNFDRHLVDIRSSATSAAVAIAAWMIHQWCALRSAEKRKRKTTNGFRCGAVQICCCIQLDWMAVDERPTDRMIVCLFAWCSTIPERRPRRLLSPHFLPREC